jgi:enamine deaminase RidA (YjgF/YER057c/UK114 family)
MSLDTNALLEHVILPEGISSRERTELVALGLLSADGAVQPPRSSLVRATTPRVEKRAIEAPSVLNEAYHYPVPSSFSRGLRVPVGDADLLFISGTASIDDEGRTVHQGDFRAQCWRTYRNITTLLDSERATWHDVVRCTCYLRDIERDYREFNLVRTTFFRWLEIDPLPASVGVQARLCREDLLVEIEALAILRTRA